MKQVIQLLIVLLCLSSTALSQPQRTWSDNSGKFSVEAELVEQGDSFVVLKSDSGRTFRVEKTRLSQVDLDYLAALTPSAEDRAKPLTAEDAEARLTKALGSSCEVVPESLPLVDYLRQLSIPSTIDTSELDTVGIDPNTTLGPTSEGSSLAQQLDAILSDAGLQWYRLRTMIVVTSSDAAASRMESIAYRVKLEANDYSALISEAMQTQPESWTRNGGLGSVLPVAPKPIVVISQSQAIHRELQQNPDYRPLPHQYRHRFDNLLCSVQGDSLKLRNIVAKMNPIVEQAILITPTAMDQGLKDSTQVTIVNFEHVSVRDILDSLFSFNRCTWVETKNGIVVKPLKEDRRRVARSQVAIKFVGQREKRTAINLICQTISPNSWQPSGGTGAIAPASGHYFTFQQCDSVMRQVQQLVDDLNAAVGN